MSSSVNWWSGSKRVTILVEQEGWIVTWAENLTDHINSTSDIGKLVFNLDQIQPGEICFILGYTKIIPDTVLSLNKKNIIVHESALPAGKGFAPLSWQILEGSNDIPICMIEASSAVDSGPIIYVDSLQFEGHELCDEIRNAQGEKTIELCKRYLSASSIPESSSQNGNESFYPRRTPKDSRLDPEKSIISQFNQLRVADNLMYPAFFEAEGCRYLLKIEKDI